MKKNIIWSNTYESQENEEKYIRAHLDEFNLAEDEPNLDDTISKLANESIWRWKDDEKENLSKELDGDIVVIGKAGLWYGTRFHVACIGNDLNIVLDSPYRNCDEVEVYCDAHNVCWEGVHHDGRNSAIFRVMKDDDKYDAFAEAISNAKDEAARKRAITRYTSSLRPEVAEIYGW